MRTQHNFCTQQLRYVGITMIVILFGLNLCAGSWENSFQEVLKAVLFGGWSIPDTFLSMFRLCSCGTKPQRSENHHFVMTSSWEPQCHHDIIMRTPRITGKPKFSWSGGP